MPLYIDKFGDRNRKLTLTPELCRQYGKEGLSRADIAKRHQVHIQTVNKHLEKVSLKEAYEAGKQFYETLSK